MSDEWTRQVKAAKDPAAYWEGRAADAEAKVERLRFEAEGMEALQREQLDEIRRLRAEVESYRRSPDGEARAVVADTIRKLKAERDLWKQRAEMAKNMLRETDAANERLRCAVAEIRAGKGRRPNPGYPDYVEAYDDWIVEVFDRWGV